MKRNKALILGLLLILLMTGGILNSKGRVKGKVTDTDNNPVAQAKVTPEPKENQNAVNETETDADGEFVTEEMDNGLFSLNVSKAGFVQKSKDVVLNFSLFSNGDGGINCSNSVDVDIVMEKEDESVPEEPAETASPIALWHLDEASWNGTTGEVTDSSGNGYNGTKVGSANTTSTAKYGRAGILNGSSDYVLIGDMPDNPNFTLMAWVNVVTFRGYLEKHGIFGNVAGGPGYNILRVDGLSASTGRVVAGYLATDSTYPDCYGTTTLQTNTWYHLASTYDGAELKVYVNGVLDKTTSTTKPLSTGVCEVAIGIDYSTASRYFNGKIDDAAIFDKALSADEILAIYNSGVQIEP